MGLEQIFFLSLAGTGALFLLVSFIIGEVGDFFDDVGDFVGDQIGFEGAGEAGVSVESGAEGPSPLSLRNLMAFLTAYGASGLITSAYGWSTLASSLFAVLPGAGIGFAAYKMMQLLYAQQSSSVVAVSDLVGKVGFIDLSIPASGLGRVTLATDSGASTFLARSESGAAIASGERVQVKAALGSELIVGRIPDGS